MPTSKDTIAKLIDVVERAATNSSTTLSEVKSLSKNIEDNYAKKTDLLEAEQRIKDTIMPKLRRGISPKAIAAIATGIAAIITAFAVVVG